VGKTAGVDVIIDGWVREADKSGEVKKLEERVPWQTINDDLPQHESWPPGFGPTDS
jgi:hypothetical protein